MTKIEGSDPKSQFMRRDLRFKCVKLGYEACSLAPAVSAEAVAEVAQRPRLRWRRCWWCPPTRRARRRRTRR